jgi:hypothetical protein
VHVFTLVAPPSESQQIVRLFSARHKSPDEPG